MYFQVHCYIILTYREATEKGVKRKYKASGREVLGFRCHLVHRQRAKVELVRMQMVLEGVGVIYKTGSSS